MDGCAWYAMRECFALSQRVPREQVDMKALFPTGRDFSEVFAAHPLPEHTTAELVGEASPKPTAAKSEASAAEAAPVDTPIEGGDR